jgi:hypothetical protein
LTAKVNVTDELVLEFQPVLAAFVAVTAQVVTVDALRVVTPAVVVKEQLVLDTE